MAVLGMRGSGTWNYPDERLKDWRKTYLYLMPNASAPLTAIMSMLDEEETVDPEFSWFEKGLPVQRVTVSGSQTSGDTTIELTGSGEGKVLKKGHALLNERTLEILWVDADPTSPYNQFTAERGKGATAAAMNDLDPLLIIGSHHEEGASIPTSVSYDATKVSNYCQIFRNSYFLTKTAEQHELRTGKPKVEAKRETLEIHAIEIEKADLFGGSVEDTSGSQPERTTKGALSFITSNIKDFADAVTLDGFEGHLEDVFENGSRNKVMLCGNRALNVFNKLAREHWTIQAVPEDKAYGIQMTEWITPFGRLMLKDHPLLSANATFQDWGFIFDTQYLKYRYLRSRDTQHFENRQAPGDDAIKNEFLTECGLELNHQVTMGIFKNASALG